MEKPTVLFIAEPNSNSKILSSKEFNDSFTQLHYRLSTKELFLQFLDDHADRNIVAIYGGYPQFTKIGGLTRDLINDERFQRDQLKCLTVCSRGYNGIDLEALSENKIQFFNYQDFNTDDPRTKGQLGNDVADCVLWHVLEGFRKFSAQQAQLRLDKHTLEARAHLAHKEGFAFGHELFSNSQSIVARSPRGQKCLILGLGSIGKEIGLKLHYGLGMEVHYCKRIEDVEIKQKFGWEFHSMESLLHGELKMFRAIIIALPGTQETTHLINAEFLSLCDSPNLTLINIGRGNVVKMSDVTTLLHNGKLRHFGTDVFEREPIVDEVLLEHDFFTSITPHIGSSTEEVFYQSCELALSNILKACQPDM